MEGSFAFAFVEGVLVKAIREGKWVLLDEINLASAETLQRLSGLLEVRMYGYFFRLCICCCAFFFVSHLRSKIASTAVARCLSFWNVFFVFGPLIRE